MSTVSSLRSAWKGQAGYQVGINLPCGKVGKVTFCFGGKSSKSGAMSGGRVVR